MTKSPAIWWFVCGVVIVPVVAFAVVTWYEKQAGTLPVLSPSQHVIGDFTFRDQYGDRVTRAEWKNKIVVANSFFTHCPSICPKMMNQLKRLQATDDGQILIASFSIDPERDSVSALDAYFKRLVGVATNWMLITGAKKDLYRFARKDLMIVATDGDGGPDDFIHSDNLVLIDRQGRIRGFYKGTDETDVNQLLKDINKLENEPILP